MLISVVWTIFQSYVHEHNQQQFVRKSAERDARVFQSTTWFQRSFGNLFYGRWIQDSAAIVTVETDSSSGLTGTDNGSVNITSIEMTSQLSPSEGTIDVRRPATTNTKNTVRAVHKSSAIHLRDLLRDPVECERLQSLAINCFSAELILFCMELENFRNKVASRSVTEQIALAVSIMVLPRFWRFLAKITLSRRRSAISSRAHHERSTSMTKRASSCYSRAMICAIASKTTLSRTTTTRLSKKSLVPPRRR